MIGNIPSYGDYVRQGSGGPQGICQACKTEGPMDHSLVGYECPKCRSMDLVLKLKDNREYHQVGKKVVGTPANA